MKINIRNWFAMNFPVLGAISGTILIIYFTNPSGFIAFVKPLFDPLLLICLGSVMGLLALCHWIIMNVDPITGEVRKW